VQLQYYWFCSGHYVCNEIDGSQTFKQLTFWTWSGVDLFFVLSGFLIGRILINSKGSKNYFKKFYVRRFFRIFPAYYLILLAFAILLFSGLSSHFPELTYAPYPFYSYLFYLQNFWMAYTSYLGPSWLDSTWSLAVEEQFYLILPLLIFLVSPKNLPRLLIFGIVLAPICRSLIFPDLGLYVLLPARMDSLLIGVLIAHYHLKGTLKKKLNNKETPLSFLLAICFIVLLICGKITGYPGCGAALLHSILMVFYGLLLVIVLIANTKSYFIRFLSNPVMSFIARISFMIYLTHQIFNQLLHQMILHTTLPGMTNFNGVLVTLLSLITTLLFSTISYYSFESPMLNIGKKYNGEKIKEFSLIVTGALIVYAIMLYVISLKWKYNESYYQSRKYCDKGIVDKNSGNQGPAKIEFEEAVELNPQNSLASNYLGLIYLDKAQYDSASHYFIMSCTSDSLHYGTLMNISISYAAEKNYAVATIC
jgi:peptidoglycan/LPS O-acetylase OafA/YrhL